MITFLISPQFLINDKQQFWLFFCHLFYLEASFLGNALLMLARLDS